MKKVTKTSNVVRFFINDEEINSFHKKALLELNDVEGFDLFAKLNTKLATHLLNLLKFEKAEEEIFVPESVEEIRRTYDAAFLSEVLALFKAKGLFVHATSKESAKQILKIGLNIYSEEKSIYHTARYVGDLPDDDLLYELFNGMHRYQKQIVVVDGDSEDLVPIGKQWRLPEDKIVGYIDIDEQKVVHNDVYIEREKQPRNTLEKKQEKATYRPEEFSLLNQIKIFNDMWEKLKKQKFSPEAMVSAIDNFNTEIRSFLMTLIASIQSGSISFKKNDYEKFLEFVNKVEKEEKIIAEKFEKMEKEQIEEEKRKNETHPKSDVTMDDTDELC